MCDRPALPVDSVTADLVAALRREACIVLRAPTGAGKTTRVPPALLDADLADGRRIVVLEPRRIAARAAARRMAHERGGRLGEEVGYAVRFDQQAGPRTRLLVVTEGVLIRMLQDDPFLEEVGAVVFDEFHERTLNSDLALGMVRRVQQTVRPDLRIVVMSATLAVEPVVAYLGGCPAVVSEGRLHPVEVRYLRHADDRPLAAQVASGVAAMLDETPGDVLVFLPGIREIRQARKELEPLAGRRGFTVMELYGDLPAEQQDAVLSKADRRKVVLATNVAETSVTIEGITAVVDSGLARTLVFDARLGLDRLKLTSISRASADQRAGRAGRLQPGVCLRLWTEASQRARPEAETPEVRRVDLAGPALQLRAWGEADVLRFPWFEPPLGSAVQQAEGLLERLGALRDGEVTDLGRAMARLPVQPRLARLLIAGSEAGEPERVAMLAALLSERSPFQREDSGPRREARRTSRSDVLDRVRALEEFERTGRTATPMGEINRGAARFVLQARDQLLSLVRDEPPRRRQSVIRGDAASQRPQTEDLLLRALLAAYPDRLARRRAPHDRRGVMVGGRGVRLAAESAVLDAELFVCVETDAGQSEALVRQASAVEREWLPSELLTTTVDVEFDAEKERVIARRRVRWDDLVLDEAPTDASDSEEIRRVLAEAASVRLDRVVPLEDVDMRGLLARVRCLRQWMPELELPVLDERALRDVLPSLAYGCRSFADLRKAGWLEAIRSSLTPSQLQAVEREAPERVAVPSGSRVRLQYEEGRPPVLAVRIQEVFGLRETPRVAGGRVPVLLHLLAPNMRPQQITDDLRSFWDNTYPLVRKELRRRYPKHAWPENPWEAGAERRPGRGR